MANNKTLFAAIERKERQLVKLKRRQRFTKTNAGWDIAKSKIEVINLQILNMQQQILFNGLNNKHRKG